MLFLLAASPAGAGNPKKQLTPEQTVSPTTPEGLPEGGVIVKDYAPDGSLISTQTAILDYGETTASFSGSATEMSGIVALGYPSGCRNVDAYKTMYTLLGGVAYRWHQTKHWCWVNNRIYGSDFVGNPEIGYYLSHNDGFNVFQGISGQQDYFYLWNGSSRGGHYSMRQAAVQNCFWVCLSTFYPYVRIWVNANGAWSYMTGS